MKEYNVRIRETLEMVVTEKASSMEQARAIAQSKWKNSEYVLESDSFKDVTFQTLYPKNRDYAR